MAAYPPPTRWQPSLEVHWEEAYFRQVARRTDQMVVMMYDTSLKNRKFYQALMSRWTRKVVAWAEGKPVLLGLPAYEDAGVDYHDSKVENLRTALSGIHGGLGSSAETPTNYQGIALYSEWTMKAEDWEELRRGLLKN